jgi:exopolyphosphatase/guanosine-5'-triphosphate,3'-diphosphate pyrophosphatase
MYRSSIDIGSNSILLLAVSFTDRIENEILNLSSITSLGKDLDKNGCFLDSGMKATLLALKSYQKELLKIGINPSETIVTATEASRVAKNALQFFEEVKSETGFNVQIISGDDEAYFTALGVCSGLGKNSQNLTIMDIGGASTELIKVESNPFKISSSISYPVGSVRATDWKNEGVYKNKIEQILSTGLESYECDLLVCVAGSMTGLAGMFLNQRVFNDKEIDGTKISYAEFSEFVLRVKKMSADDLLSTYPFLGKRASVISGGAEVASEIAKKIKVKELQISTRGLRYGVIVNGGLKRE